MPSKPKKTTAEKFALAQAVYTVLLAGSESFEEDCIGADGLYLVGAILKDGDVATYPEDRPSMQILRESFPREHPVWRYFV